ncbi:MAG: hypothetical protein AAGA96_16280 [Verrucomicrobiota bacterium]
MTDLLMVTGAVVLSIALRSFGHWLPRKLGAAGILVATFLACYLPTGSIALGLVAMSIWFLLPWIELLTRVRRLRLPLQRSLEKQPPPGHARFPSLTELTDEVEEAGFEYVADTGWDWEEMTQFYRLFFNEEDKAEASICLTEQDGVGWVSLSLTSRAKDGRVFRTTNVPFSNPMQPTPEVLTHQVSTAERFDELHAEHKSWLENHNIEDQLIAVDSPEDITESIENEAGRQIRHNLEAGLVRLAETAETVRYSWRGLFYLYFQVVKDMVKLC